MSLPHRQQSVLDQIERALQAADPRLTGMFADFGRVARAHAMPSAEVIVRSSVRRTALICLVILSVLGALALCIRVTSNDCPGLRSDQSVASAAARYAACGKSTDAWSKGAR
jgi:hypothetical protein